MVIVYDGNYEYDLVMEDNNYVFYHSNSESWQSDVRGTLAYKVLNDGNGIILESKKLDYSQSFLLYVALRLEHKNDDVEIGKLEKL